MSGGGGGGGLSDIFHARVHEVVHNRTVGSHRIPRLNEVLVRGTVALIGKIFASPMAYSIERTSATTIRGVVGAVPKQDWTQNLVGCAHGQRRRVQGEVSRGDPLLSDV